MAAGGAALNLSARAGAAPPTRSFAFAGAARSTGWLPFHFYREGQILLDGRLNGRPVRILLDSGVSGLVIHQGYALVAGIVGGDAIQATTVSSKVRGRRAASQSLAIGPLSIAVGSALILDMSALHIAAGRSFDVMLGRDLFEQLEVDIDFAGRRLAAHHPDAYAPPPGAIAVPLVQDGTLRALSLSVGGRAPILATFDLGSTAPLIVSGAYARRENLFANDPTTISLSSGAEGLREVRMAMLGGVMLAGVALPPMPVVLSDRWQKRAAQANAGIGLLSRFRIITDYARNLLFLIPLPGIGREFRRDRSGLRSQLLQDRLRVLQVAPASPAARAGWKAGEEIVAVNGWRIGTPDFSEERSTWTSGPAGTAVQLTLADGSKRELVLADYF